MVGPVSPTFGFVFAHLANPKDPMPLQASMSEIDGAFVERPVEVAAANQNEIHEVAGEFQQAGLRTG